MAKILLNRIEIVISTKEGEYGFRQDFDVGLNLLQADTSRGKSTCLQAIIFVLGLEKALTSKNEIPLTPAVLKEIQIEDGSFLPVLESNIYLEIENSNKERICIQRTAKGKRDNKLITVWFGPRLTNPKGPFRSQDFFVKDAGSASREAGFYTFLAKFFEWSLPIVATYQNGSCPLYMETIFPLLFVEQKRGWGSIQSTLPTYLGIRDMSQRTIEFLLDLDVNKARQKKHELNDREKSLTTEWKFVLNQLSVFSKRENARCLNLPLTPVIQWPSLLEISIEIFNGDKWIGLPEYKKYILEEVQKIEGEIIPKTEDVSESLSEELNSYYDELFFGRRNRP